MKILYFWLQLINIIQPTNINSYGKWTEKNLFENGAETVQFV